MLRREIVGRVNKHINAIANNSDKKGIKKGETAGGEGKHIIK